MQKVYSTSRFKINFMKQKKIAFAVSLLLSLAIIYNVATKGLNFGVDFTGGIVIELKPENNVKISKIRKEISAKTHSYGLGEATIQTSGQDFLLIRIATKQTQNQKEITHIVEKIKTDIKTLLGNNTEFRKIDFVGPQVGGELIFGAVIALVLSFIGIIIYIWVRFDWQYGLGAFAALLHDGIIVLGVYSFTGIEFNITSVAAILTVIGYSVNDSVVIYDRIRENLRKYKTLGLDDLLNMSINDTLSRTVLTASTTLASLLALILVGGDVIFGFSFACFIGIIVGTYSSIYISAPILEVIQPKGRSIITNAANA